MPKENKYWIKAFHVYKFTVLGLQPNILQMVSDPVFLWLYKKAYGVPFVQH
jgi:hypothetical protein